MNHSLIKIRGIEFVVFLAVFSLLVFSNQFFLEKPPRPVFDSIRYIHYGINLEEQGVFGLFKDSQGKVLAGNENTPLYPFLISLAVAVDKDLKSSLTCLLRSEKTDACPLKLESFAYMQSLIIVLILFCVWLTAYLLFKSGMIAWASALMAFVSGELQYYANHFMTEIVIVLLFSFLILLLVLMIRHSRLTLYALLGVTLGLLTLTRPEYHYLFLAGLPCFFIFCVWKKRRILIYGLVVFFLAYYAVVGSWQLRNYSHFQDSSITGNYGSIILAYRTAYNRMTWPEWGVAFIYWFPDVGDSIAENLFHKKHYEKLGFDSGSYYSKTSVEILNMLERETDSADEAMHFLLRNEILGNLFKHSMVSIPLFWRGLFIAKYWGVLGLLCFLILLFQYRKPAVRELLLLSLPAWFLVALHAFVSINVTRYNLVLLPFYAISIAVILAAAKEKLSSAAAASRSASH